MRMLRIPILMGRYVRRNVIDDVITRSVLACCGRPRTTTSVLTRRPGMAGVLRRLPTAPRALLSFARRPRTRSSGPHAIAAPALRALSTCAIVARLCLLAVVKEDATITAFLSPGYLQKV
jgi:hypothetical protein